MAPVEDEATPAVLPTAGVTSRVLVKGHLSIDLEDTADDVQIDACVDAVDDLVRDLPTAARSAVATVEAAEAAEWRPRTVLGATMLAARLHRRRNSPDGVAALLEAGVAYVQRNDPDVGQLLELGSHQRPMVG